MFNLGNTACLAVRITKLNEKKIQLIAVEKGHKNVFRKLQEVFSSDITLFFVQTLPPPLKGPALLIAKSGQLCG